MRQNIRTVSRPEMNGGKTAGSALSRNGGDDEINKSPGFALEGKIIKRQVSAVNHGLQRLPDEAEPLFWKKMKCNGNKRTYHHRFGHIGISGAI